MTFPRPFAINTRFANYGASFGRVVHERRNKSNGHWRVVQGIIVMPVNEKPTTRTEIGYQIRAKFEYSKQMIGPSLEEFNLIRLHARQILTGF